MAFIPLRWIVVNCFAMEVERKRSTKTWKSVKYNNMSFEKEILLLLNIKLSKIMNLYVHFKFIFTFYLNLYLYILI